MMKRALILSAALCVAACEQDRRSQDAPSASSQSAGAEVAATAPTVVPASPAPEASVPNRLTQQPQLLDQTRPQEKPRQASLYTPPAGSPERVALMNALREQVRGDLGGDPVFVVRQLRSDGQWAFGQLDPTWRDGRAIRPEATPLYRRMDGDAVDGLHTEAIWRKERGRWQVFAHNIGATDVWWLEFCDRVPRNVLGGGC